ncbi:hypothetical protein [Kitasatospora acidiphila]|uniref:hypothetical protein n=1 Tax=Kitasatospora acidiphila TaxID=2567942 RepID=UPI003C76A12A
MTFAAGMVLQLSGPDSGVLNVQPAAFQSALTRFDQIDAGQLVVVMAPVTGWPVRHRSG